MDDKSKKLKRMATWTVAVFATVFSVFMALFWLVNNPIVGGSPWNVTWAALATGWPLFLVTAFLCIATYFGYNYSLGRKK